MNDQTPQTAPLKEQSPKQQVVEALKKANNVLVTISTNPTVDQLSACIGLTLMMNKLDKHATAVFSGVVPSTLEFLEPEKTIEQTTDSLRDFIISLDKSKADKLRYKVEDDVVRIYITPYRTSINQEDLDFTQGDFNVDVVVALGIDNKDQLDGAIIEHGQILHDAVVIDMSFGSSRPVDMGSINWHEPSASSLCEMLVSISEAFKTGLLDTQMSTAFLTGIVAETERFSNEKTTPKVMTMSAQLMAAGANQQLIANQLALRPVEPELESEPEPLPMDMSGVDDASGEVDPIPSPGELDINHVDTEPELPVVDNPLGVEAGTDEEGLDFAVRDEPEIVVQEQEQEQPSGTVEPPEPVMEPTQVDEKQDTSEIDIDEHGKMTDLEAIEAEKQYAHKKLVLQPLGTEPPQPKTDLSKVSIDEQGTVNMPDTTQLMDPPMPPLVPDTGSVPVPVPEPVQPPQPQEVAPEEIVVEEPEHEQTLEDLERAVVSPHVTGVPVPPVAEVPVPPAIPAINPQIQADSPVVAPPDLPPPFVPPYMQPQPNGDNELNLPSPQ